jgi:putative inorganic carbon (HCO3(-)) transporter
MNDPGSLFMAALLSGATIATIGVACRTLAHVSWQQMGMHLVGIGWMAMLVGIAVNTDVAPPVMVIGASMIGVALLWFVSRWCVDRVELLLIAGAIALPIRIPIPVGGETANLLAPLYVVIALAITTQIRRELQPSYPRIVRRLPADVAVTALVAWCTLSFGWTFAPRPAAIDLALFIIPFATIYVLLRTWWGIESIPRRGAAMAFGMTMLSAGLIGIFQHATRTVWSNPKVIVANQYAPDFRTNSIFWDPNIYGRYLMAGLLLAATVLLARSATRPLRPISIVAVAVGLLALWYTYSQSSLIALACGLVVLVFAVSGRTIRTGVATAAILMCALAPTAFDALRGADTMTRESVVTRGLRIASMEPVSGIGIGSFEEAVAEVARNRGERVPNVRSSHTSVVTVLAELGVVGLVLLIMLVAVGLASMFAAPAMAPDRWWGVSLVAALALHSMFYASLLEDPLTWIALAVGAAWTLRTGLAGSTTLTGPGAPHMHPAPSADAQSPAAPSAG